MNMNALLKGFLELPLLEKISVSFNVLIFVLFLFFLVTRRVVRCIGGVHVVKEEGSNGNPATPVRRVGDGILSIEIGTGYKTFLFCCIYVLFLQVLVLGVDIAGLIREGGDWFLLYFPIAQVVAWFILSYSALHCKFSAFEKFPLLPRVWWFVSFIICLCTLYNDGKELVKDGSSHLSSHVFANFATTPALAFICFVATRGDTGIQICRNRDLQEPLLHEEDVWSFKVTPYSDEGILSLATLSWLNPLLSIGAKRPLELRDIPLVAPKDRSKTCYKILNSNWEKMKGENL